MNIKNANQIVELLKQYEMTPSYARAVSNSINEVISYTSSARPHPKMKPIHVDKVRDDLAELKIMSNFLTDIADCMET